jgi:hypothetical protein
MKDSTNGKKPNKAPRIQRPDLGVKKFKGSDINRSSPYGDQATHFIDYIESLNTPNPSNNLTSNTSRARPTMCVSSANEGKTQVGWVVVIGRRAQK